MSTGFTRSILVFVHVQFLRRLLSRRQKHIILLRQVVLHLQPLNYAVDGGKAHVKFHALLGACPTGSPGSYHGFFLFGEISHIDKALKDEFRSDDLMAHKISPLQIRITCLGPANAPNISCSAAAYARFLNISLKLIL